MRVLSSAAQPCAADIQARASAGRVNLGDKIEVVGDDLGKFGKARDSFGLWIGQLEAARRDDIDDEIGSAPREVGEEA